MLETKVNERTKELSLALKTVEEISKKKSEFISAVSHELRTPMTITKGYISMILEGTAAELLDNKDVQRAYLGKDKKEIWER